MEVKALYLNGDFFIKQFEIAAIPSLKSSFSRLEFFSKLIHEDEFKVEFSTIEGFENSEDIDVDKLNLEDNCWLKSADELEARLADELHWAGAYTSMDKRKAERIGKEMIDIICPNRAESHAAFLGEAWVGWFYQVAWDYSFLIFDTKLSTLTIICATDTD